MSAEQTFVIVGASLAAPRPPRRCGRRASAGGRARRRRGRAPLRAPAALQGVPARRGRTREGLRPRGGLLRRPRDRAAPGRTAVALDAAAGEVALDDGERLRYDRLLMTTGAEPRRLPIPGAELDGVQYLRTVEDSDALPRRLDRGGRVVVVGAGWIGSEVAASARQRGLEVTVIDPRRLPLERVLGTELGAFYRDIHADHGVRMLLGTGVEDFEGAGRGRARPDAATAARSTATSWSSGSASQPRTALAAGGRDRRRQRHPRRRAPADLRARTCSPPATSPTRTIPSTANGSAWSTGPTRCTRGRWRTGDARPRRVYDRLPYFFSDQYDVGMEYSGYARTGMTSSSAATPPTREFIAFWLRADRVVAGMNVNVWDVTDPIQQLIRAPCRRRRPAARGRRRSARFDQRFVMSARERVRPLAWVRLRVRRRRQSGEVERQRRVAGGWRSVTEPSVDAVGETADERRVLRHLAGDAGRPVARHGKGGRRQEKDRNLRPQGASGREGVGEAHLDLHGWSSPARRPRGTTRRATGAAARAGARPALRS